ncbi:MAG: hypothetical protein ACOCXA_07740, partial [Planctomycetota bacterium]
RPSSSGRRSGMTLMGWIIMLLSVGGVSLLFALCILRVIRTPGASGHLHGFEMETPDHDT